PRPPTPLPIATPQPTHLTNPPHCHGHLKTAPTKCQQNLSIQYLHQLDVTDTAQGYQGSVPEPLDMRMQGTKAHMSISHIIVTTHSPAHHELPYQVTA
ncbi:hypothetical protein PAXRUDRAFT_144332, partial [Paxillus rubicundulus Ve08.2h10]